MASLCAGLVAGSGAKSGGDVAALLLALPAAASGWFALKGGRSRLSGTLVATLSQVGSFFIAIWSLILLYSIPSPESSTVLGAGASWWLPIAAGGTLTIFTLSEWILRGYIEFSITTTERREGRIPIERKTET